MLESCSVRLVRSGLGLLLEGVISLNNFTLAESPFVVALGLDPAQGQVQARGMEARHLHDGG